ncbi:MAG: monovalent cation:proton antiporter-2 (CPA2) family protein [Lautropia sp.]|nr:monovalent cation:proton antiporter-2 (CPA2) family protein [Lautropia sp.]
MTDLLSSTFVYLAAATIAVPLANRLGLGSVLGYLLAGILIGPILGLVGQEAEDVQHVAEFGVVMMLFLVGLEQEPRKFWQLRHQVLGLGSLQVISTMAVLTLAANLFLGLDWPLAIAASCVLTVSSTAIVLQTLTEKNLLKSRGGQASFSVLLLQDIAVIPMMALLPLLAQPELGAGSTAAQDDPAAWLNGLDDGTKTLVMLGAMAFIVVGGHFLATPVFRTITSLKLRDIVTIFSLALVIGIALLMTLIGLSPALGTFLAGLVLANSEFRHELESQIEPFKGLLLGIFFVTVGAGIDFGLLFEHFGTILWMTLGMMGLKIIVLLLLGRLFRLDRPSRMLLALGLAQAGEFGFVLLAFLVSHSVMPEALAKQLLLVVALSMLLTPILFMIYDRFIAPLAARAAQNRAADPIDEQHPVLVIGHGRFGQIINSVLSASGFKTTVIEHDPAMVAGFRRYGVKTYFGDASRTELLLTAGVAKAELLVVAINNPAQAVSIVKFARLVNPGIKIVTRAHSRLTAFDLYRAGANEIIRDSLDAAIRSSKRSLELLGMDPSLAEQIGELYLARDLEAMTVLARSYDSKLDPFENKAMMSAARAEQKKTDALVKALIQKEQALVSAGERQSFGKEGS